jgi:enoyl-CoA hydratase/carnithine racemase
VATESFPIDVEQRGNIAIWTIARPERMNSLSRATLLAFGKLAREAVVNPSIRAIVITGAGDKAFCAGADLKERQGMSENDIRVQVELYRSELGPLDKSPKPVVAALNGVAFGGGLELSRPRTCSSGFRRRRWALSLARGERSGCRASLAKRAPKR